MKKLMKILLIILVIVAIVALVEVIYFAINNNKMEITNDIKTENKVEKSQAYAIENKDVDLYKDNEDIEEEYRGFKLLEYNNSSSYAEIYCVLYDYTTDLSCEYGVKVTDESGKTLLFDGDEEKRISGGIVEILKIKKVNLTSKINVEAFEREIETGKVVSSAKTQIDLSKDLTEIKKINQLENSKVGKIGDVEFNYIDDEYVYFGKTDHVYSENLKNENSSLPVGIQYGNRLVSDEHIEFSCEKNVNNLSLEKAFESLAVITEKFGQYGLSDIYGMNILDDKGEEVIDEVVITYEELMKLCNGETITKDGKKYTEKDFNELAHIKFIKDEDVEIGHGINAIKYHSEFDDAYECYMFTYKDNIYYIKVPVEKRVSEEVEAFFNSLKFEEN